MSIECYLLQTASPEGFVPSVFVHEHEEEMKERVGRQWVIDGEGFQCILPCLPSVILIEIEITTSLPTAVSVKYQLSRGPILYMSSNACSLSLGMMASITVHATF